MGRQPKKRANTARSIARLAQTQIKNQTGQCINLVSCPEYQTTKNPESMLAVIARALGMDATCYKLRSRQRPIVELRFIASHFLRSYFPTITLLHISYYFGGFDHTSIINGLTRANNLIACGDEQFLTKYQTVLNSVNQWLQKEVLGYASAISA